MVFNYSLYNKKHIILYDTIFINKIHQIIFKRLMQSIHFCNSPSVLLYTSGEYLQREQLLRADAGLKRNLLLGDFVRKQSRAVRSEPSLRIAGRP